MKTYKILLTILLLIEANLAFSQKDSIQRHNKIIFSIAGGVAIPFGDFSTSEVCRLDKYSPVSCIASGGEIGWTYRIEGKYMIFKNFGLMLIFSSTANKAITIPADTMFPFYDTYLKNVSYDMHYNESWYSKNILAGITAEFGDSLITGVVRLAGGYQQIQSPGVIVQESGEFRGYDAIGPQYDYFSKSYAQSRMVSKNFVFNCGVDISWHVKNKLSIIAGFDVLASKGSFNGEANYTNYVTNGTYIFQEAITGQISFDKNITVLCFNAGLSYSIK